ncbi:MAG: ImmA/IrrE family metallo-endopeptidase [Acidobacteria bacterium]|jgi:hypothetical protein|nr:ImmA/IrrE family metallo-endopeptidase [Acidobacteriota bacterium]
MTEFVASFLHLESQELVQYLLRETGHQQKEKVSPKDLLDYLKLQYLRFDFMSELPKEAKETFVGTAPRAMISFHDRLVATDVTLNEPRTKFSVLHEVGHYILPGHQNTLYVCDRKGMSYGTHLVFEQEANQVAADLLFLGDRFDQESNSRPISADTVKTLAFRFGASFEATARRIAERSYRDCMLVCFSNTSNAIIDAPQNLQWHVQYCIPSASFENKFFQKLTSGGVPEDIYAALSVEGRDIDRSENVELSIGCRGLAQPARFNAEFFYNRYHVFCFLTPADEM